MDSLKDPGCIRLVVTRRWKENHLAQPQEADLGTVEARDALHFPHFGSEGQETNRGCWSLALLLLGVTFLLT